MSITNIGPLVNILRRGEADPAQAPFLWVGAGLSIPAGYPSLGQLAATLRDESVMPLADDPDSLRTIDAFVKVHGEGDLLHALANVWSPDVCRVRG